MDILSRCRNGANRIEFQLPRRGAKEGSGVVEYSFQNIMMAAFTLHSMAAHAYLKLAPRSLLSGEIALSGSLTRAKTLIFATERD
jgi:hypothetical protein